MDQRFQRASVYWIWLMAAALSLPGALLSTAAPSAAADQRTAGEARPARIGGLSAILTYHPYDPSSPGRMTAMAPGIRAWNPEELAAEIRARARFEMDRRELAVCYYRIGHTISFPLPLAASPKMEDLPVGIQGIVYPWYTWLSWSLEERWRLLHAAWRQLGDGEAGAVLQRELAALAGWTQSCEEPGSVSLGTAHVAGCLALALSARDGWGAGAYEKALAAAGRILERDVHPWFEREWPEGREIGARELQNIRVIALARAAQLARVAGSPLAAVLGTRTRQALRAWFRLRLADIPYNEGSAYDGFLMDSLTGWLAGEPDREERLREGRESFASLIRQWLHLALPGRPDAQAPLGDVEPEMPFWMTSLHRLAAWSGHKEGAWLVRRLPAAAMPAALLAEAIEADGAGFGGTAPPLPGPAEHPHAVTLRTGWEVKDILAAVGLTRTEVGHLHDDAGQVVLGWRGRFWITDPGYQQYRPGAEREYSIGPEAHNVPVISGKAPTKRAPRLVAFSSTPGRSQRAVVDLSACYEGLPPDALIEREVRLLPGAKPVVAVRDRLKNAGPGAEVRTFWQGGTELAWSFREGWTRLSDGEHALWIGVSPGDISAAALDRHAGSRGPLTLSDRMALPDGNGDRFWIFAVDDAGSWMPPADLRRTIVESW